MTKINKSRYFVTTIPVAPFGTCINRLQIQFRNVAITITAEPFRTIDVGTSENEYNSDLNITAQYSGLI